MFAVFVHRNAHVRILKPIIWKSPGRLIQKYLVILQNLGFVCMSVL